MRATLNIPDSLIQATQEATGQKSKTRAIAIALEEFVRQISDILIAAVAIEHNLQVFTLDSRFEKIPGVKRYRFDE